MEELRLPDRKNRANRREKAHSNEIEELRQRKENEP